MLSILGFWRYTKSFMLTDEQNRVITWFPYIVLFQFFLGILTILFMVPVWLGVMHQAGAFLLLATWVYVYFIVSHSEKNIHAAH